MSTLTANGAAVLKARITLPRRGAWVADVVVDAKAPMGPAMELATFDGALRLHGTVERGDVAGDAFHARVVGGAGGLARVASPKAYRFVTVRAVAVDILGGAGESLSPDADGDVLGATLPYWTLDGIPAGEALSKLTGDMKASWRVLSDGSVWVGRDGWPSAAPVAADLLEVHPSEDRLVLGVDAPRLLAGTTFQGRRVSLVVHTVTADCARSEVWFERDTEPAPRLTGGLGRLLARALRRLDTLALYPARVVSQNDDGTLELKPDAASLPGLSRVPIRVGLPGVRIRVEAGARVLVGFEEGDPRRPVATLWEEPKLIELRVGGDRGVARIADSVLVPVPRGYSFKAQVTLAGGPPTGNGTYALSEITVGPIQAPDALVGTIVTGSEVLKA